MDYSTPGFPVLHYLLTVIHAVKGFSIVNEAMVDVFSGIPLLFSMTKQLLAIWSLVLLPFLNPGRTSGCSQFMYCWSLPWRILSITLLACLYILSMQILTFFLVLLCSYSVFSVVLLRFKINFLLLSLVLACTLLERSSVLYKLWEVMQRLEWEWIGRRNCCQPLVPGGWGAKRA